MKTKERTPLELFSIDLTNIQKKITSLPTLKLSKLDGILSDSANEIWDTYDYICLIVDAPDRLAEINSPEHLKALDGLLKQVTTLFNILYEMNYDSKYMDRLQHTLRNMEDDIPKILNQLKK